MYEQQHAVLRQQQQLKQQQLQQQQLVQQQQQQQQPRGLLLQQNSVSNSENGNKQRHTMKSNKPLLEKKRRARINKSLEQLKALLMEAIRNDTSAGYSKLEKADILEMAVKHLRQIHRQQQNAPSTDADVLVRYCAGFNECAQEVNRYLTSVDPAGSTELRLRLMTHLAEYMSPSSSLPTSSAPQHLTPRDDVIYHSNQSQASVRRHMTSPYDYAAILNRQRGVQMTSPQIAPPRTSAFHPMASPSLCDMTSNWASGPPSQGSRVFGLVDNRSASVTRPGGRANGEGEVREEDEQEDSQTMWCHIDAAADRHIVGGSTNADDSSDSRSVLYNSRFSPAYNRSPPIYDSRFSSIAQHSPVSFVDPLLISSTPSTGSDFVNRPVRGALAERNGNIRSANCSGSSGFSPVALGFGLKLATNMGGRKRKFVNDSNDVEENIEQEEEEEEEEEENEENKVGGDEEYVLGDGIKEEEEESMWRPW